MEYNFKPIKCAECKSYWSNEDCDDKSDEDVCSKSDRTYYLKLC